MGRKRAVEGEGGCSADPKQWEELRKVTRLVRTAKSSRIQRRQKLKTEFRHWKNGSTNKSFGLPSSKRNVTVV
jgi:hypothetical protein